MISLLTQELNNYDYDYHYHYQTNIKKKSNNPFEKKIEKSLENKFQTKSINIKECSLNIHSFNPTKNSPPNEWQSRLIKRINSLNYLDSAI